jgi:DNA-binding IclR family transcriptional regulator
VVDAQSVRSVERAIDVLLALSRGPRRLADISTDVVLSRPTTYRLLSTMKLKGVVLQDHITGDYRLGPTCFRFMSSMADGHAGFPAEAARALEELRDATSETVTVHVMAGPSRICVQELPSPSPIRYTAGLGATAPIHCGSAGKILLAFLPQRELDQTLRSLRLTPVTTNTITDPDTLRAELSEIARTGTATSMGERVVGAIGVSAPVFDSVGRVLAAISVLGPAERLGDPVRERARTLVRDCAGAISSMLREASDDGR